MKAQHTDDQQGIVRLKEELVNKVNQIQGQLQTIRAEFEQKKLKKLTEKIQDDSSAV
jgi:hypothetical protein